MNAQREHVRGDLHVRFSRSTNHITRGTVNPQNITETLNSRYCVGGWETAEVRGKTERLLGITFY